MVMDVPSTYVCMISYVNNDDYDNNIIVSDFNNIPRIRYRNKG
jgi:hypothetical protein